MFEVQAPYLTEGEKFIHKAEGSYASGLTLMGGVVFLTNERVIFKSRGSLMLQSDEVVVYLKDVAEIKTSKTPIQIPNGFILMSKSTGKKHRFVVRKHKDWTKMLEEQMNNPASCLTHQISPGNH